MSPVANDEDDGVENEINMTRLVVDVILILLIVLVVTIPGDPPGGEDRPPGTPAARADTKPTAYRRVHRCGRHDRFKRA